MATARPILLKPDGAFEGGLGATLVEELEAGSISRWYRVELATPAGRTRELEVSVDPAVAIEIFDLEGRSLGRSSPIEGTLGPVYVHVTAPRPMTVSLDFISFLFRLPPTVGSAGVLPRCNANDPDYTMPSCCAARCNLGRNCTAKVVSVDGSLLTIAMGADEDLMRGATGVLGAYGSGRLSRLIVIEVRERDAVAQLLEPDEVDLAHLGELGAKVSLGLPAECPRQLKPRP